ncbi:methyl-accepting chemotaxis protein [Halomonas vilamensis]|uniref:Methyl-accepting chemotaxis protein n=1 Tax=Vreelandella vilamensis TaxID=531309 RepID=A0ABU1H521_9GAMM|nr:methyl-accepting chemotaxis protein [Halomonas vilamensis]MDR5899215.1 methyl-accepting chemotaxis protein [Halomonas vilamensis]
MHISKQKKSTMPRLSLSAIFTSILLIFMIIILVLSIVSLAGNRKNSEAVNELTELGIQQLNNANLAYLNISLARERFGDYITAREEGTPRGELASLHEAATRSLNNAQSRVQRLASIAVDPQSQRAPYINAINTNMLHLLDELLVPALAADELSEAITFQPQIARADRQLTRSLTDFARFAESRAMTFQKQNKQFSSYITIASIALFILSLLTTFFVRHWLKRSVIRPVDVALAHLTAISKGDLTESIHPKGCKELSSLLSGLVTMQSQLALLVGQIQQSTENIAYGAGEIAQGGESLASRTEEQASALQQTAASMEELTTTVKNNADHTREANTLTTSAADAAEQSGSELEFTLQMMSELAESSNQVQEIVGTIDGIAFQTNLLALNASVEAARAGEHGRGFAVVAEEVRTLASRSANAAKEIRELLNHNVKQITNSAEQAEKSGTLLREMVSSTRRVSSLMSEIATATQQQQSGIEQISTAVNQMDAVTQQNASLVEQSSTAAASLNDQAALLSKLVKRFHIENRVSSTNNPQNLESRVKLGVLADNKPEWSSF